MMAYGITRERWERHEAVCLSKGRAGNARVYLVRSPEGAFVVKDFRKSPWWIRWTFGRFMIGHECRLLRRLEGIPGVPQKVFRVDAYAFGMAFMEGETLSALNARDGTLPERYFEKLEAMVREMHRRGVTHLDNRNAKNVMVLPGERPGLLDFQAGVTLRRWYPRWVREVLCLADLSGVYKHWYRVRGELSEDRKALLRRHFRLRRLWVFKGYALFKRREPKGIELYLFGKDGKGGR